MFNPAAQLDQMVTDSRNRASWAAVSGAALRGELGAEKQRIALESYAAEYRALKAAGRVADAAAVKRMVKHICGVED